MLALAALAAAVVSIIAHFPLAVVVLVCLAGAAVAAWWGVRRTPPARTLGLAAAALLVAGSVALAIAADALLEDLLILAAVVAGVEAARRALRIKVRLPPAPPPQHPVLLYNPRSGGGKAERFHLAEEARAPGHHADRAGPRGATWRPWCAARSPRAPTRLAMAGGDGSQAIVARWRRSASCRTPASRRGRATTSPWTSGSTATTSSAPSTPSCDGGERRVDLAEVNGRVFVNNVSLGLYAEAVQRPGYREAKLRTLLDTVPDELGPDADASGPQWDGPEAAASRRRPCSSPTTPTGSAARWDREPDRGSTPACSASRCSPRGSRLHRGACAGGRPRTSRCARTAGSAGIDGEAVELDPPLRFRSVPRRCGS